MDCEELDQLEWDFIQTRAGSLDIDSLGWTRSRVFVPWGDTGSQAGGASGRTLPRGLNTIQRRKLRCQSGPEGLAAFSSFHLFLPPPQRLLGSSLIARARS